MEFGKGQLHFSLKTDSTVKIQGSVTKLQGQSLKVFSIRMVGVDENRVGGPFQKFGESPSAA